MTLSIRAVANGPQCDLVLCGDIDLEVADAVARVANSRLAETGVRCLLLDLAAVTFMDSTGLGALVTIRNAAEKQGKDVVLGNVPERIRKLLVITGLDGVFQTNSHGASGSDTGMHAATGDGSQTDTPTDPQLRVIPS